MHGLERLYDLVEREGICLSYDDLTFVCEPLLGLYFYDPAADLHHIVIEESLKCNLPMHRSILAEELGHYFTVPQGDFLLPYTSYRSALKLSKDETKALRWACDFLMPSTRFTKALSEGYKTTPELAEYFEVTPWLIETKIKLFRMRHPLINALF